MTASMTAQTGPLSWKVLPRNPVDLYSSLLVCFLCCITARINAQEVSWLADVQQPPSAPSTFETGTMEPLLPRADGSMITTKEQWTARRAEIDRVWQEFLGPNLKKPDHDNLTTISSESIDGLKRDRIRYECEPGLFVEAYLLRPLMPTAAKLPSVVVLHHTANATIDEVAGISGRESLQLGFKLAKRGFIAICPPCFLWHDSSDYKQAAERFIERQPKSLGMRKMLFDAQRAVDILTTFHDVDPNRIGAIGHSLGAKETLYLAAFDQRIKAAVACEGGLCFRSTNWDAIWYLGPAIREPQFKRNHHELLALTAPRAMLVIGGEEGPGAADGDRSWPHIVAALPVYEFFGKPPRLGLLNHHQGHSIPEATFQQIAEWFESYLGESK